MTSRKGKVTSDPSGPTPEDSGPLPSPSSGMPGQTPIIMIPSLPTRASSLPQQDASASARYYNTGNEISEAEVYKRESHALMIATNASLAGESSHHAEMTPDELETGDWSTRRPTIPRVK